MKITAQQYAKALYELTADKKHREIDGVVAGFLKELDKNGQLRLANDVIKKFREIYNAEHGIVEAEVITKEKISESLEKKIKQYVSEKYSAKEIVLHNKIDENVKGGIVIRVGDEVMDGSISRQLDELKKSLIS